MKIKICAIAKSIYLSNLDLRCIALGFIYDCKYYV